MAPELPPTNLNPHVRRGADAQEQGHRPEATAPDNSPIRVVRPQADPGRAGRRRACPVDPPPTTVPSLPGYDSRVRAAGPRTGVTVSVPGHDMADDRKAAVSPALPTTRPAAPSGPQAKAADAPKGLLSSGAVSVRTEYLTRPTFQ